MGFHSLGSFLTKLITQPSFDVTCVCHSFGMSFLHPSFTPHTCDGIRPNSRSHSECFALSMFPSIGPPLGRRYAPPLWLRQCICFANRMLRILASLCPRLASPAAMSHRGLRPQLSGKGAKLLAFGHPQPLRGWLPPGFYGAYQPSHRVVAFQSARHPVGLRPPPLPSLPPQASRYARWGSLTRLVPRLVKSHPYFHSSSRSSNSHSVLFCSVLRSHRASPEQASPGLMVFFILKLRCCRFYDAWEESLEMTPFKVTFHTKLGNSPGRNINFIKQHFFLKTVNCLQISLCIRNCRNTTYNLKSLTLLIKYRQIEILWRIILLSCNLSKSYHI